MGRLSNFVQDTTYYAANAKAQGYTSTEGRDRFIRESGEALSKSHADKAPVDLFEMISLRYKDPVESQMQGCIVVRDTKANNHYAIYSAVDRSVGPSHAEPGLFQKITSYFNDNGTGLSSVRVVLNTTMSPCTDCSSRIQDWWKAAKGAMKCGDNAKLVVTFNGFYCKADGAKGQNQFKSKEAAQRKYTEIANGSDGEISFKQLAYSKWRYPA